MSTLKVTNIESPSGGGVNAKITDINGGQLSNRNLIINGAMNVAQRGTSFTSTSSGYKLDRFRFGDSSPGVFDVVQSSTAPAGFSNSLKVDCTTAVTPSTTEEMFIETKIEAQDLQHLQFGTSGAQSVTLSFHVKSNKTGSYGLWVYQDDASTQYATTYTISSANTWEYKTITIPGNTASAINDDNGTGLVFRFYLLSGPAYAGTPTETWTTTLTNRTTSLNLGDDTANEWLITGVQLEVGDVATAFEHRSYGDELQRCERYFQTYKRVFGLVFHNYTTSQAFGALHLRQTMRTNPTAYNLTAFDSASLNYYNGGGLGKTLTSFTLNQGRPHMCQFQIGSSSQFTEKTAGHLDINTGDAIQLEAEL